MKNLKMVIILSLTLLSCSKKTLKSTELTAGNYEQSISFINAQEDLQNEANLVMLGKGNQENLLKSFNHYLAEASTQPNSPEKALNLRSQLIKIFNDRINLYINLLNDSLSGTRSPIALEINDNDPKSALIALQTLYNSLGTKKSRSQLTLADQYLVFDLTIALKEKFSAQNQETIPTKMVVTFLKEQVAHNKKTPNDTFFAYQIAHKILDSSDDLYTVFFPILSQIVINKNSSATELELFKRLSMYAVENNFTDFVKTADDISLFLKNISFVASNKIERLKNQGFDQRTGYFETIDYSFKAHSTYLGKMASEQSIDIESVSRIQDAFIESTYFDFLRSLNNDSTLYARLFQESCLNFKSNELELLLTSYMLNINEKHPIPCIKFLKDKIKHKNFEYLTTLRSLIDKELIELESVENPELKNYLKAYTESNLSNLLLNIIAKNDYKNTKESSDEQLKRHAYIYNLYNQSKISTLQALSMRNQIEKNNIAILTKKSVLEIQVPAGIFQGNIDLSKSLILHPLAVLIPEDSVHTLKFVTATGGRIDANFNIKDYNQTPNKAKNRSIFRGSIPVQNPVIDHSYNRTVKLPCKGKGGKGSSEGGCGDNYYDEIVSQFSRTVTAAKNPDQALEGEVGINGNQVQLDVSKRNILETPIYSFGLQGFKGNQGFSAPLCNDSNEYQVFFGIQYFNLKTPSVNKTEYKSYAGKSGNGGIGGNGGRIQIQSNNHSQYPALSLGGPGGIPGDSATCTYPNQVEGIHGNIGPFGANGLIEVRL